MRKELVDGLAEDFLLRYAGPLLQERVPHEDRQIPVQDAKPHRDVVKRGKVIGLEDKGFHT